MAKSLRCNQCNTLLKSVAEAQNHSEATGHIDFEETTEVIKILLCKECGKKCRTQAERDLHTRHTSHTEYVDETDVAAVLDTEKQMKEAAAAMDVDSDNDNAAAGDDGEQEMVPVEVDAEMLSGLQDMGFPENRSKRAIHFSGASTVEGAINWLVEHEGDEDIDDPLFVPKAKQAGPKLTPEEARQKAEELVRKARERREKEERETERLRELERIRMGKEIQAAKRAEEEGQLRRNAEARRREKEEDARYREALRLKLEEDKKARRRKLGLPEEPTPEELAAEAAKKEAQRKAEEEAAKKRAFLAPKPISVIEKLRDTLVSMKKSAPGGEAQWKTACATLLKYLGNIAGNPDEPKFRSIRLSNAAFQQRVAVVPGSVDFLKLCGFQEEGEVLTMSREAVQPQVLQAAGSEINNAVSNPFFGAL